MVLGAKRMFILEQPLWGDLPFPSCWTLHIAFVLKKDKQPASESIISKIIVYTLIP